MDGKVPPEARELHRSFSGRALEILEQVGECPDCAEAPDLGSLRQPTFASVFHPTAHPLPLVISGAKLAAVKKAALAVPRLIRAIPERLFDNDPERIARFYGVPEVPLVAAILRPPTGMGTALARGDFVDTASGLKCLELNVSARLGGFNLGGLIGPLFLSRPWLRSLLTRKGAPAVYTDPARCLFRHLVEEALGSLLHGGTELNVAFLFASSEGARRNAPALRPFEEVYAETLEEHYPWLEGSVCFASYEELRMERHAVHLGGRRIHAVLEYHDPFSNPAVFQVSKAGGVHLYNGPVGLILDDKRNLALLSESEGSDRFDAGERELIRSYVPWTRIVQPGWTEFEGERVRMPDLLIARREDLVLKHSRGLSGQQVHVGRHVAAEEWARRVEEAMGSDRWIVQEWQRSLPYWYWDGTAGRMLPHEANWGMFAYGERYSGGFVRIQRDSRTGVLNGGQGATPVIFLEIEGNEPA